MAGRNHPINFDVVTYFDGYDHSEPACAQPGVRFLPEHKRIKRHHHYLLPPVGGVYRKTGDAHRSRPVSVWKRLSNRRILLAVMVKQDSLLYAMTLWISRYRLPLASFPILLGGPQKMMTGFPTARWRNSGIFRATLKTLEWATTLRLVWFPTSASNPKVGASFMRITHSVWSISAPAPVPRTWLELVTSAQWWHRRDIFLKEKSAGNNLECLCFYQRHQWH